MTSRKKRGIDIIGQGFPSKRAGRSDTSHVDSNLFGKLIALKISSCVVALRSFIGKEELFISSGVIVESKRERNNTGIFFLNFIVTAASLVARSCGDVSLPHDIEVRVYLADGKVYDGEVCESSVDFHYNIAVVKVMTDAPLPVAVLRDIHTCSLTQGAKQDEELVQPGDLVVALGRIHLESILLVEVGQFSIESCALHCQELFMTSCQSSTIFTGGPLINRNAEVIGINFSHDGCISFLPTNIVLRCVRSLKKHEFVHRPWHGIKLADLYLSNVGTLENLNLKFPDICGGVIVEEVKKDSAAELTGLLPMDVIVQCNGHLISCSLQFFEMMWDKTGETVELLVKRANGDCMRKFMTVEETKRDRYNRWPIWERNRDQSDFYDDHKIVKIVEKFYR